MTNEHLETFYRNTALFFGLLFVIYAFAQCVESGRRQSERCRIAGGTIIVDAAHQAHCLREVPLAD